MSFLEKMRAAAAQLEAAKPVDPWRLRLERVRGTTGFDGLERISTQTLLAWSSLGRRVEARLESRQPPQANHK